MLVTVSFAWILLASAVAAALVSGGVALEMRRRGTSSVLMTSLTGVFLAVALGAFGAAKFLAVTVYEIHGTGDAIEARKRLLFGSAIVGGHSLSNHEECWIVNETDKPVHVKSAEYGPRTGTANNWDTVIAPGGVGHVEEVNFLGPHDSPPSDSDAPGTKWWLTW